MGSEYRISYTPSKRFVVTEVYFDPKRAVLHDGLVDWLITRGFRLNPEHLSWVIVDDIPEGPIKSVISAFTDMPISSYYQGSLSVVDPLDAIDMDRDDVGEAFSGDFDSALRAETPENPRVYTCPSCYAPYRLTRADRARAYQCDSCARESERGY